VKKMEMIVTVIETVAIAAVTIELVRMALE
jgi:hypothetical protein